MYGVFHGARLYSAVLNFHKVPSTARASFKRLRDGANLVDRAAEGVGSVTGTCERMVVSDTGKSAILAPS